MTQRKVPRHLQPATLQKAADELKELLREGRGMCNDLRKLIKEAQEVTDIKVGEAIDKEVAKRITEHLDLIGEETQKTIKKVEASILKRFGDLEDALMGDSRAEPSIDDIVRVDAWRKQAVEKERRRL